MSHHRFVVPHTHDGQRLDVLVAQLAPSMSRRGARRLIEDGAVFVDGKRVQVCSRAVRAGARLEVAVAPEGSRAPVPEVGVIALEADVVVANKPSGMPTEPTREGSRGTLSHALAAFLRSRGEATEGLAAAHRLDTDTTGVVMFSRNPDAARIVGRQLHDGTVERVYLAIVEESPSWENTHIAVALSRSRGADGRIRVEADGLPCSTRATVLVRGVSGTLVQCTPETGRTHQIRVHLAHIGHPLVGDRRYGRGGASRREHLGLHALSIALTHPRGHGVRFAAPVPQTFVDVATSCGISATSLASCVAKLVPEGFVEQIRVQSGVTA